MLSRPDWEFTVWSVRRAVHRRSTYVFWAAWQVALLTLLIYHQFEFRFISIRRGMAPPLGGVVFSTLHFLNPLFLGSQTLKQFGSSIADYRTRGDAGLIQMAWHSPRSFFVGAIAPCIVEIATILLMQIPFVVLIWTMGGVRAESIYTSYLALVALLTFLAGVATFYSVIATSPESAKSASSIVAFFMVIFPYIFMLTNALLVFFEFMKPSGPLYDSLESFANWMINFSAIHIFGSTASLKWFQILIFIVSHIGMGLLFFRVARNRMNASFHSDVKIVTPGKKLVKESSPVLIRKSKPFMKRPGKFPIIWKTFYFDTKGWPRVWIWSAAVLFYFFLCMVIYNLTTNKWAWWQEQGFVVFTVVLFSLIAIFAPFAASSNSWRHEKQDRTVVNLCLTPISMSTLMWHKIVAAVPCVLPLMASAGVLLLFVERGPAFWGWTMIYSIVYFLILFSTLSTLICLMTPRFGKYVVAFGAMIVFPLVIIGFPLVIIGLARFGDPLVRYYIDRFNVHLWGLGMGLLVVLPIFALSMRKIIRQMEIWTTEDVE